MLEFWKFKLNKYMCYEDGIGVVEMILLLVVIISLVLIFKENITDLVNDIFKTIEKNAAKV
jgi:competence protein ComGC